MNHDTTCPECGYTWDARTFARCARCCCQMKVCEPTAVEIHAACLAIQATWTRGERRKRTAEAYRAHRVETATVHQAKPDPHLTHE